MFGKLILTLAVFCYVQAETPDEVIQEMKPKLDALNTRIDKDIQDGYETIKRAQRYVQSSIGTAETILNQGFAVINETVEQAKTDANANGQNIDECVTQAELGVKNITETGLEYCKDMFVAVTSLIYHLNDMRDLKSEVNSAPQDCKSTSYNDVAKLRSCLESTISVIDNYLLSIIQKINDSISSYEKSLDVCVDTSVNETSTAITQILADFNFCINKS